jgi:DNA polymerase iota
VAHNKLLAKLVSGLHKPDDQTALNAADAAAFLAPLPVCSPATYVSHSVHLTVAHVLHNCHTPST